MAHIKTWQWAHDVTPAATAFVFTDLHAARLVAIVNALITFGTNPWIVRGCSDAVTGAMDGVFRWSTVTPPSTTTIGGASNTPHPWIVLENAAGVQVLIDYWNNTPGYFGDACYVYFSPSGSFTGGDNAHAPTAPDQVGGWRTIMAHTPSFENRFHIVHSTDGLFTVVVGTKTFGGTHIASMWILGTPINAPAEWENPFIFFSSQNAGLWEIHSAIASGGTGIWFVDNNGVLRSATLTIEQYGAEGTNPFTIGGSHWIVNEINAKMPMYDVGLLCLDPEWTDFLGNLPDVYWGVGTDAGYAFGDTIDSLYLSLENTHIPWDMGAFTP